MPFDIYTVGMEFKLKLDGKDFEAALGKEPQHGEDAYLKKNYDLGVKGRPKTDEYDRADYKNMNLFVLVKQGELLAERVLQTDGEPSTFMPGSPSVCKTLSARSSPCFTSTKRVMFL